MINLVGYRVIMAVCLHRPNWLIKLPDDFYLLQQKTKNHLYLICAYFSFHTCVDTDVYVMLKVCVFSEQKDQTSIKIGKITHVMKSFRILLLQVPQNSASRTISKMLTEAVQPPRLLQVEFQISQHFPISQRLDNRT